jgi:hypothetical protein
MDEIANAILKRNVDIVIGDRLSSTYFIENTGKIIPLSNMLPVLIYNSKMGKGLYAKYI